MNINNGLFLLILIFSFTNCIYLSEESFNEIEFMTPTKFEIDNIKNKTLFKYKLSDKKGVVGLKFLEANSYIVNVTTYSSYDNKKNKNEYKLAKEQFKEINVTGYDDYLYIVIEITKPNYFYDDYLTIYDSEKSIELEHNKVISINNFLSSQLYKFFYKSEKEKTITLFYNTQNYDNNYRTISIEYEGKKSDYTDIDSLNMNFEIAVNKNLTVNIINKYKKSEEKEMKSQGFTIMIREIEYKNEKWFKKIEKNNRQIINYIYSNESQIFYFYANITGMNEINTLNLKLDYKYYKKGKVNILSNYAALNEDIKSEDFDIYKPTKKVLIDSYDKYSDEYLRIYLNNYKQESNYLYILASVEITDESYYYGSKSLEISIGEEEEIVDFTNIKYNIAEKIEKQTLYYIPYYWKLKLNKDDIYLLGIRNENIFVTTFIDGDLIIDDKSINFNVLESNNEIIVLENKDIFTIKLFGIKKNVDIYIERIKKDEILYVENNRKTNQIYTLNMIKDQTKYILGTYSYDDYAFGKLSEKYYATKDSGEFEVLFYDNVGSDEHNLFPKDPKYSQKFNEIIDLKTHIDLFTIKCKSDGIMYIRPQYKHFNYTVHLVGKNNYKTITMGELIEVVHLTSPLGKRNEILYFAIKLINGGKSNLKLKNNLNDDELSVKISPDTEGAFENGTIKGNEIFYGKINLSNFQIDQLGIFLNSTNFGAELEIVEVVHNKYTSYKKISDGENKNIESNNVYLPIANNESLVIIDIENLKGKKVSYTIIQSAITDTNYITTADNYPGANSANINDDSFKIHKLNNFCNKTDSTKPNVYLLFSVNGEENNLKYNLNITYRDPPKYKHTTTTIGVTVICVIVVLLVVGVIIFCIISKRRRNSNEIGTEELIDPNENKLA